MGRRLSGKWVDPLFIRCRIGPFKPTCVNKIMTGNPLDLARDELRRDVLDLPGRNTAIDRPGFDPGTLQDDCPGRNDRIPADVRIVHHDSPHPDQYPVLDRTTMNDRIMTDRNIVPDPYFRLLIRGMDHYAVLDVDLVPDVDTPHVSSYHGVKPNAAVIPDLHFTNDSGIRCDETTMAKARGLPFYG